MITSEHNGIVKEIKLLRSKRGRQKNGMYFIEGIRLVREALLSGARPQRVVISEDFDLNEYDEFLEFIETGDIVTVSQGVFNLLSDTDSPQGILAVFRLPETEAGLVVRSGMRFVVLENLQDPGNAGTIIRTADAAGFDAVFMVKGSVDIYNPKVLRSAMGSVYHIPVIPVESLSQIVKIMKEKGIRIAGTDPNGAVSCFEADMGKNISVIIGNEANGMSEQARELADIQLTIPMQGKAESLNASVAAAILLFESTRQALVKSE